MSGPAENLVEVQGLRRVFDLSPPWLTRMLDRSGKVMLTAVDGVDFSIRKGETYALVGESGSGKSTIAKMAVGLLPPSAGSVRIGGIDVWGERDAAVQRKMRSKIQMIFQDPYASLNPRWRVRAIIEEPIKAFSLLPDRRDREARVAELLTLVGLDPKDGQKFPHEFSGGQRQRIGIARALALNPKLLVCDEAVSALDVSIQAQVINLLEDLREQFKLTYIFIAHDLSVVEHISHRVAVMYLGRIVEVAPSRALYTSPKHPYTEALLSAVPIPDPTVARKRIVLEGDVPSPIHPPSGCHFHPRCPRAQAQCRTEAPLLRELAPGHVAACHFPN